MKNNDRLQALNILLALVRDKHSLAQSMPASGAISPLTKEICFGFCRHYFRLEAIAHYLVDKKPKDIEVWVVLLIGLYQLHYMRLPDYAVVQETVALLSKVKKIWAKGLVNAVLRNFCRRSEEVVLALAENEAFIYGQSPILLNRLKSEWPEDWKQIAAANDAHPPMTLRVNLRKNTLEEYQDSLKKAGIETSLHPVVRQALTLAKASDVKELPGFAAGQSSVQDAAAQIAVSLLDLKPGLRVLDACCAPGGKTCHILETEVDLALCLALDLDPRRLKRVQENLDRLQLKATLIQADALKPEQWWDGLLFDRILLDAPCSATGVIRRHSDIKLLRTEEEVESIIQLQKAMLSSLWPLLAPGGTMIYATCSIIKDENENQIADFLERQADAYYISEDYSWGRATGHGQQILPGEQGMDGFFYSVLGKKSGDE